MTNKLVRGQKDVHGYDKAELEVLKKEFYKNCKKETMTLAEFRSMLGIFGLEDASFICDRLFSIITSSDEDEVRV